MRRADDLEIRIPDMVGEVIAWRAWELVGTEQTPRLASVTALTTWSGRGQGVEAIWPTDRFFLARCPNGHVEEIPVEDCSCGLYAARDVQQLIGLGYGAYGKDWQLNKIVGQVALSGKVIEGSQGWRAERGRVYRLFVPYEMNPTVGARLEAAYRVPVEPAQWIDGTFRTLDDLAERVLSELEGGR
jgi:hypothetical protein